MPQAEGQLPSSRFFALAKGEVYIEMSSIHNHSPAGESWKFEMPFSGPGARASSLGVRGGLTGVQPKLHPAGTTCLKIRVPSGDRNLIMWGKGVQFEDRKMKILLHFGQDFCHNTGS